MEGIKNGKMIEEEIIIKRRRQIEDVVQVT